MTNATVTKTDQALRPEVILPGGGVPVSQTAVQLGELLAETGVYFYRGGAVVALDRDDQGQPILRVVKAAALPSIFESVARLQKLQGSPDGPRAVAAICSEQQARLILNAPVFPRLLPPIRVQTRCPVLVERGEELVQIVGFDRESGILADGDRVPDLSLNQAQKLLAELLEDFQFTTPADHSRALAAIITPALVHGALLGGRPPLDLGEGDASQSGKGFRNKLTAAVYNGRVSAVAQRKGGVGNLEESFNHALVTGSPFISLDNIRGKVDLPALESFLTEDTYLARIPYSSNVEIDPRRVVVMMTSNQAKLTHDLANRSSCVLILKQPEGYSFRQYPEGDILDHVRANQPEYLAAVFRVIREWHATEKPRTHEARHSFRPWARALDWIVQKLLNAAPLLDGHRETQTRMTTAGLTWMRQVGLAIIREGREGEWLRSHQILDVLTEDPEAEIPGVKEGEDVEDDSVRENAYRAIGRKLSLCFDNGNRTTIDSMAFERRKTTDARYHSATEYRLLPRGVDQGPQCARNAPAIDPAMELRDPASPAMDNQHYLETWSIENMLGTDSGISGIGEPREAEDEWLEI